MNMFSKTVQNSPLTSAMISPVTSQYPITTAHSPSDQSLQTNIIISKKLSEVKESKTFDNRDFIIKSLQKKKQPTLIKPTSVIYQNQMSKSGLARSFMNDRTVPSRADKYRTSHNSIKRDKTISDSASPPSRELTSPASSSVL